MSLELCRLLRRRFKGIANGFLIDKDAKEACDQRIFDMWMACYTGPEIA
jgi:hypothetical protein